MIVQYYSNYMSVRIMTNTYSFLLQFCCLYLMETPKNTVNSGGARCQAACRCGATGHHFPRCVLCHLLLLSVFFFFVVVAVIVVVVVVVVVVVLVLAVGDENLLHSTRSKPPFLAATRGGHRTGKVTARHPKCPGPGAPVLQQEMSWADCSAPYEP